MNIEKLKNELISQKNSKFKGNIYHYSQVNFAYNSNKIEDTHLSDDETVKIFVTNSYISKEDDVVKLDDLIEMNKILKKGISD
jgi:filamentation induced by cAMP protein fic